jgi:hypothetical protein
VISAIYPISMAGTIPAKPYCAPARSFILESLTKLSEAILARRAAADSTSSTARPHNNARRVL